MLNNQIYEQYCSNRLPCGICRLTNSQCPKTCGITIDWSKVTCTANSAGTTADTKTVYTGTTGVIS